MSTEKTERIYMSGLTRKIVEYTRSEIHATKFPTQMNKIERDERIKDLEEEVEELNHKFVQNFDNHEE